MTPPRVLAAAGVSAGGNPGKGANASLRGASGTPPPNGLPGNGRQREPAPHPALRGHLPPRGKARVVIPPGVLAAAEGRGGVGAPRPTDGDMETLWDLRGHPFPGRRVVGAGHARPGGWCGHPSMVRPVGRGLDPSAGDCPGDGRWRKVAWGVGDAAPYGLPGNGRLPRLTLPTSPPAYSRCCRRQNRWGQSAHRPDARFRRWIRSRRASGHRRSGPEGTGVCRRRNFSSAG